jgi:aryl-alcohol dehydrogenase-like predicted oxidoreductase
MRQVYLGTTGLQVSELCLGTMTFGKEADPQASAAIYRRCREAGINFFDCANVYSHGESERILGGLIAGERDRLILTSKVGGSMGDGPNRSGLSRRNVLYECEQSLRRLRTDWIDIYFAHRPADLGGDDQPVALLGDDLAQDALRLAAGVNIGAVEKVDAGLAAAAVDGLARPAVGFLPERHGPQAKLRDLDPGGPQIHILHFSRPPDRKLTLT